MADRNYNAASTGSSFSIITILFVIIGLLLIYYLYRFLNTSAYSTSTAIIPSQKAANVPPTSIPPFPQPYEGGDYSVNTWIYLNSLNTNNKRKHVLELKGKHFSTLLLGIGAFKNSLVVRTHYKDLTQGFENPISQYTNAIVNPLLRMGSRDFRPDLDLVLDLDLILDLDLLLLLYPLLALALDLALAGALLQYLLLPPLLLPRVAVQHGQ